MKRLILPLLVLVPLGIYPMEPEESMELEQLAKRFLEGRQEELPGPLPLLPSQIIAQELLAKDDLKGFILSQVSVPFRIIDQHEGRKGTVYNIGFTARGDKMKTVSANIAKVVDLEGNTLSTLYEDEHIQQAQFNAAGDKIAISSGGYKYHEANVTIYGAATGQELQKFEPVWHGEFNRDGDKMLLVSPGVRIADVATGDILSNLTDDPKIITGAFNPAGNKIITGSSDGSVMIWDVATGMGFRFSKAHTSTINKVLFSPMGDMVASSSSGDYLQVGTVNIWDIAGNLIHSLPNSGSQFTTATSLEFDHAGKKILIGTSDGAARLWNIATGELIHTLKDADKSEGVYASFNQAGDNIIAAYRGPNIVKIWDTATGKSLRSFPGQYAVFAPDGHTIAVADGNKVKLGDLALLLKIQEFLEKEITLGQAVTLNAIFETMKAQGIVKALGPEAFEKGKPPLLPEEIRFDFNKYPNLWNDYASLPEALRRIFDPYVIEKKA